MAMDGRLDVLNESCDLLISEMARLVASLSTTPLPAAMSDIADVAIANNAQRAQVTAHAQRMALAAQSISSIVSEVKVAHALYDSEARRRNMLSVVAAANEQTSLAYDQIDRLRSDISRAIDDIHRHLETSACPPAHR
ncbi:Mediator of RNA polymerase II transcription subunit 21 [Plasmodiophora brassicae]|uniref:Uncharacterized protein n=1 Tax=Plasmodiophora brassicae TaxID=37360 RepID=A0A0G4IZW0_PLABS|nr:hypothetical protein PBRA_001664 [Plasmodiophora brassicae]SPQ93900.1 unnamed protein product [Plasmodiophora brassicae]